MERHFDLLATLYFAYAGLLLLAALLVGLVLSGAGALSGDADAQTVLDVTSGTIAMVLFVLALPYVLAGLGLRRRQAWGRTLALILGALALLSFPLGTALGAYALWTLTRPEAHTAFR